MTWRISDSTRGALLSASEMRESVCIVGRQQDGTLCVGMAAYRRLQQLLRYKETMKRRPTHAWALLADEGAAQCLGEFASEGLEYARLIAETDRRRCEAPIRVEQLLPAITISEIAEMYDVSPSTVRRRIALARQELFGSLTMSGIYDRQRRARKGRSLAGRVCAASDCNNVLPTSATVRREFCHSRCRRREHYRRHLAS